MLVKKLQIISNQIVRLIMINIDKLKKQKIIQNFIQIFMKNLIIQMNIKSTNIIKKIIYLKKIKLK